jgi:hypothetical protein
LKTNGFQKYFTMSMVQVLLMKDVFKNKKMIFCFVLNFLFFQNN